MSRGQIALFIALALGTLLISGAITLAILVRLPTDYFKEERRVRAKNLRRTPIKIFLLVLKNLAGVIVIAIGVVLSVPGVPGQGILTILIGVMLLDFPGKYRLERRIIGIRRVRSFVDRLRQRFGRPPLDLSTRPAP